VERPFRYIRKDFFLGRTFRNMEDLNAQLIEWLETVANVRVHGTTQRVVAEAFAEEQRELQRLPEHRFNAVLSLSGGSATTGSWRSAATITACVTMPNLQEYNDDTELSLSNIMRFYAMDVGSRSKVVHK